MFLPTPGATKTGVDSKLAVAFEFHAPPRLNRHSLARRRAPLSAIGEPEEPSRGKIRRKPCRQLEPASAAAGAVFCIFTSFNCVARKSAKWKQGVVARFPWIRNMKFVGKYLAKAFSD